MKVVDKNSLVKKSAWIPTAALITAWSNAEDREAGMLLKHSCCSLISVEGTEGEYSLFFI